MTHIWHDPAEAVAEGIFDIEERVIALLETGETVELEFTWLAYEGDELCDAWTGFAVPDGDEILNSDIKSVRAKDPSTEGAGAKP